MGFGESIAKLIETYTNCISLLKVFNKHARDGPIEADDASSLLRRSLRSDRSQVRRAYASQLSINGRRLEKGDEKSRGLLRKTLKRLNAAIVKLLHSSNSQNPMLDYDSLMQLSNSSRVDAVRAIDQLSQRLGGSPSRRSLVSSVSASASSSKGRHRRRHSNGSKSGRETPQAAGTKTRSPPSVLRKSTKESGRGERRQSPDADRAGRPAHLGRHASLSVTALPRRISMMSVSTDSTKLGEIPERRRLRRQNTASTDSGGSEDYNVRPTYPLKPYQVAETKSRGLWGMFSRRL